MSPTAVPCCAVHCSAVSAGRVAPAAVPPVPVSLGGVSAVASVGVGAAMGVGSGAGGGASIGGTSGGGGGELPQAVPTAKSRDERANSLKVCAMVGMSLVPNRAPHKGGRNSYATAKHARVVECHMPLHIGSLAEYMKFIEQDDWAGVGELMLSSATKLARIAGHLPAHHRRASVAGL